MSRKNNEITNMRKAVSQQRAARSAQKRKLEAEARETNRQALADVRLSWNPVMTTEQREQHLREVRHRIKVATPSGAMDL